MKVLVVGGGGREHALCWKLKQSPSVTKLYCAPGNAGIALDAECVNIPPTNIDALLDLAKSQSIDLSVVGPEDPLTNGIVDRFEKEGLRVFGPSKAAAEIEGSKVFAKELMKKAGLPTADFQVFTEIKKAHNYAMTLPGGAVIKADGLAAGKGVIVCKSVREIEGALDLIMTRRAFGSAGDRVVVERLLKGEEASFLAFTDGETCLPMASCQDHKAVFDEDKGPNTGGMGAYSPAPVVTEAVHQRTMAEIMIPAVKAMAEMGRPYRGVLYAGLMIRDSKPYTLEFNARFGDPETQPLLIRMKGDLAEIMLATVEGNLSKVKLEWDTRPAVCVVMASGGYPGSYEKGKPIGGLDKAAALEDVVVFHAGTKREGDRIVTSGGRVLGVTAIGKDIPEAINRAYQAVSVIKWEGVHYRKDIGAKAIKH